MFSFRQKIFVIYLIVFLVFLALLFPLTKRAVEEIVSYQLAARAHELIGSIRSAPNTATLIHRLRQQEPTLFSRVTVLNGEGGVLYDSHTEKLLGKQFIRGFATHHPEVVEALEKGSGFSEGYSNILGQEFVYVAIRFDFHGSVMVLRTAFPYQYIAELTQDFQLGFLIFGSLILALFSSITWFSVHYLSRPIQQIIRAIKPYQSGNQEHIPIIVLEGKTNPRDDFVRLASTLNSLSEKIQKQIDTLTEERNEKQAILESLVEGVIAFDEKLRVTFANNMAINMLGFSRSEILFNTLASTDKDHPSYRLLAECHQVLKDCQLEEGVITSTLEYPNKLYLDIVAAPKDKGVILVLQDKTSHYAILEMRKNFIANASHELKTPITIIKGFAETLQDNTDLPKDVVLGVMTRIVNNCHRMDSLVKNLLRLADIENLPVSRLLKCNVLDIIEACYQMLLSIYPDATVEVEKDGTLVYQVIADPDLLELAFRNLFENAAKYTRGPATVRVSLKDLGENIEIKVSDRGIGIPEEDIEYIFQRFYTVDKAHSRKLGGSGLGLSIVETIIHKHKGDISLASKVGEGTTFTIILPKKMVELIPEEFD